MAVKGNNFHLHAIPKLALAPQSVAAATVTGPDLLEGQTLARQVAIILAGGAIGATATGITCTVQGKKRSDGTYANLKQADNVTDLTFTAALLQDTAQLENGIVLGTINYDDIDTETYSGIRLSFVVGGAGAALVSATYVLYDLRSMNYNAVDDLFLKLRP